MLFMLAQTPPAVIPLTHGLGRPLGGQRRSILHTDPIEASIVRGEFKAPVEGKEWRKLEAGANGDFVGGAAGGGYVYITYDSPKNQVMLLNAAGDTMVYVNGEPRAGDPYSFGYLTVPVLLKKGTNSFLFLCGRGHLKAELRPVVKPIEFDLSDATLPDLAGEKLGPMGVMIRNATAKSQSITVSGDVQEAHFELPPASSRKVPLMPTGMASKVHLVLKVDGKEVDSRDVTLGLSSVTTTHKVTFLSQVDGSAQYYGLNPAAGGPKPGQALVLSLHGASVEALGQAQAYGQKTWANIAAATNRRPYGFDWEDVGRLDAIEVLDHATATLQPDKTRIYLNGHSMGGHGTWQVGALFPDRFAGIAPCSGWESMFSYAGSPHLTGVLEAANRTSDTLKFKDNYKNLGVYIVHGSADDNVPPEEARNMFAALSKNGQTDLAIKEYPGQGHWYDTDGLEPGADCLDNGFAFDMFARRRIPNPSEAREINFTCSNPGVNGTYRYLNILSQQDPSVVSVLKGTLAPGAQVLDLTTTNVRVLQLKDAPLLKQVVLDGQKLAVADHYTRDGDKWQSGGDLPSRKPSQMGGFKAVFKNRVAFIYGTHGTKDENAWAYAKARYDAETFYYRGNAHCLLIPDDQIEAAPGNVILYGNARTNSAWPKGLATIPNAPNAGTYRIAPYRGGLAGLVGGDDLIGMRLCDRVPLFTAGCGMPDYMVLSPKALEKGLEGVLAAGYFDDNWHVIP